MTTAQKILVSYGVIILAYGFVLGFALAAARSKSAQVSRHLVTTHLSALMQSPIHLGIAFTIGAAHISSGPANVAAVLLVVGSAAEAVGGTANWLQHTNDQFAEKSLGLRFNSASAPVLIAGIGIIIAGVVSSL